MATLKGNECLILIVSKQIPPLSALLSTPCQSFCYCCDVYFCLSCVLGISQQIPKQFNQPKLLKLSVQRAVQVSKEVKALKSSNCVCDIFIKQNAVMHKLLIVQCLKIHCQCNHQNTIFAYRTKKQISSDSKV